MTTTTTRTDDCDCIDENGFLVSDLGVESPHDAGIEDALTERLDACEHMFLRERATAVTNTYPDDAGKDPKTYVVQDLRVSTGDGTCAVTSCTCRDYRYRRLPSATQAEKDATPEGEMPPDPLDVDPENVRSVLWGASPCKHINAVQDYERRCALGGGR